MQGLARLRLEEVLATRPFIRARVSEAAEVLGEVDRLEVDALLRNIKTSFQQVVSLSPLLSDDLQALAANITDPAKLANADFKILEDSFQEDLKNGVDSKAIVLGGSGQGEAIVANRVLGIRAAVLYNYNEDIIKLSREHNDANILSLGARFISEEDAKKAVKAWIETEFSREERHQRRIEKF